VGAQTVTLAKNSPDALIPRLTFQKNRLRKLGAVPRGRGSRTWNSGRATLDLHFEPGWFDHLFVCFVLEHLSRPREALVSLKRFLRPGVRLP